jgi:type I restriction enzyme S subunit
VVDNLDRAELRSHTLERANGRSIERLREFRAALITAAVTGQIDVARWGKKGQTDRRLEQIEKEMTQREGTT